MKLKSLVLIIILTLTSSCYAADISTFLKSCGMGVAIGAGIGLVSLAAENKPSEHYASITRGASLGLYGGIAYGAYLLSPRTAPGMRQDMDYGSNTATVIIPTFAQNKIDGFELNSSVYNF